MKTWIIFSLLLVSSIIASNFTPSFANQIVLADDEIPTYTTIFITPPITDERILPTSTLPANYMSNQISIGGSPGEYLSASFTINEKTNIIDLLPICSDLAGPSPIPATNVDMRWVKCWLQAPNSLEVYSSRTIPHAAGVYIYENRKDLMPELLLHDDSLVEVSVANPENPTDIPSGEPENWVKMIDGSYRVTSIPALFPYENAIGGISKLVYASDFPVMDAAMIQPATIPANTNKQVWITIKIPDNALPGNYTGTITLNSASRVMGIINIALVVYNITLQEPIIEPSIFSNHWIEGTYPEPVLGAWRNSDELLAGYLNLKEHGSLNPVLTQPWIHRTNDKYVNYLRIHLTVRQQAGMVMNPIYWHTRLPISNTYIDLNELSLELQVIKDIFAEFGCTELYIYGQDEQAVNADQANQIAVAHEMGLKVMNSSHQEELATGDWDLVNTYGQASNWSINHNPDPTIAAYWHARGARVYSYSNPQGGVELPETYRRNYGLKLWQGNYDGSMTYGWQDLGHAGGWDEFGDIALTSSRPYGYKMHNMVYPTVSGVIDTVQWEGWREGLNDIRYLSTLLEAIEKGKAEGIDTSIAEAWLDELKTSNLSTDNLDTIRSEMIDQILSLGNFNQPPGFEDVTSTVAQSQEEWDVNGDGIASVLDMILVGQRWGETGLSGWIKADTNKDGTINVLDMIIIGQHWT